MRLILFILISSLFGLIHGQESEALSPLQSFLLDEDLKESSGLIYWEGSLWTHNDSRDNTLYRINPANGLLAGKVSLAAVENTDWEDIAQDKEFIYIGDIGNNSGNRKDLHILRISKESLKKGSPEIKPSDIDTIFYSYDSQEDFTPRAMATDFDCEAMIVHRGQIFLFTKEWISAGTSVYTLPVSPGQHVARKVSACQVDGLITGADISADGNMLILCGYSALIQPFFYVLVDPSGRGFENGDLFGGSVKRIPLALPYHQVEGIAIKSAEEIFFSNEYLRLGSWIEVPQQVHLFYDW